MVLIQRLAHLVLLGAIATDVAAAKFVRYDAHRKLVVGETTEFAVTGSSGGEYLVEFSEESGTDVEEIVVTESEEVPDETIVTVVAGSIKTLGSYCLLDVGPSMHLDMRVTAPVPSLPVITYITGLSIITKDVEGLDHTIEISVKNPHSLDSSCPAGVLPCLAHGALSVKLDDQESLLSPGEVTLGPGVAISAVNLPGACRSFGFEKYWERKKLQNAGGGRKLEAVGFLEDIGEWILADPTATNMEECAQYVAAAGETGLFDHASEHASFQIMTPTGTIRLTHGRLHQLAMRDPTDQFDLPDHLTWHMNVAIDHHDVSLEATGVLGETVVPTVDANGKYIMKGIDAIRGSQEDC
eukprot:g19884.t1